MSALTEETNILIDPETEVKKLQDLVKKLELQNELLRSTQNNHIDLPKDRENLENIPTYGREKTADTDKIKPSNKDVSLEEVDLLELDRGVSSEEEDSWLYSSPKPPSAKQRTLSPYKWVRQDFEHGGSDLDAARKSLVFKLEDVRKSPLSPSGNTLPSPVSNLSGTNSAYRDHYNDSLNGNSNIQAGRPTIKQPLFQKLGKAPIDTGTFTRTKKKRSPVEQRVERREGSVEKELDNADASRKEEGDMGMHKLGDMVDVQVLARMQEESLRQSMASPITSPRRSVSKSPRQAAAQLAQLRRRSSQDGVPPLALGDMDPCESPHGSNRSSPGRFDDGRGPGTYRIDDNMRGGGGHSLASSASHSSASSPPDSPYSSQYINENNTRHTTDNYQPPHRRSLPNLAKSSSSSTQSYDSEPQVPRPASALAQPRSQIQQPSPRRPTSPKVHSLRDASPASERRAASPRRAGGIPTPRSSIPRPGSGIPRPGSGIPGPRRSGIPAPRSTRRPAQHHDESWKEGCY